MDTTRTSRTCGLIGLAGAVLLTTTFYFPDNAKGGLHTAASVLGGAGLVGLAVLYLGYRAVRAAGPGRFGTVTLLLLASGHLVIIAAGVIGALAHLGNNGNPIYPLGGLLILAGGLLAGTAVTRARVLRGWRRWPLLVTALVYLGFIGVSIIAGTNHHGLALQIIPSLWPVSAIATAAALATAPAAGRTTAPARSAAATAA